MNRAPIGSWILSIHYTSCFLLINLNERSLDFSLSWFTNKQHVMLQKYNFSSFVFLNTLCLVIASLIQCLLQFTVDQLWPTRLSLQPHSFTFHGLLIFRLNWFVTFLLTRLTVAIALTQIHCQKASLLSLFCPSFYILFSYLFAFVWLGCGRSGSLTESWTEAPLRTHCTLCTQEKKKEKLSVFVWKLIILAWGN